ELFAVGYPGCISLCTIGEVRTDYDDAETNLGPLLQTAQGLGRSTGGSASARSRILRTALSHVLHGHAIGGSEGEPHPAFGRQGYLERLSLQSSSPLTDG